MKGNYFKLINHSCLCVNSGEHFNEEHQLWIERSYRSNTGHTLKTAKDCKVGEINFKIRTFAITTFFNDLWRK
jgi:hypothetical protein